MIRNFIYYNINMNITKNHVIAIVLILAIYWVYSTWDYDTEHFKVQKWGNHYYYDNENEKYPITPSIVSCDIDKLPKSSVKFPDELNGIPVSHNVAIGEAKQTASHENINQIGANLNEIMQQEYDLMKPLHEIRQTIREMNNMADIPEMKEEINSHITHESIIQELHETQPKLVQDLSKQDNDFDEKDIEKSLMSGMEQKKMIETKLEINTYDIPQEIPQDKSDYNLSIAILLSVLLIGFVTYTN